ncbi:MAG: methylmalonyl Co-A mutase-associated GTPase MeaB, partial [Paludibacteraceae bacterium]|nr:methylmalonyl Co-A mutase-associated GTPase MeaB [Paludibacteraceae bacterium]
VENTGITEVWKMITDYIAYTQKNGYFDYKRSQQAKYWMYETIHQALLDNFYHNPEIETLIPQYEQRILDNEISSFIAAHELLNKYNSLKV